MIARVPGPEAITAFLSRLDGEASEAIPGGEWVFANGESVFCCTTSARRVVDFFGGRVVGFFVDENPTAKITANDDGHDFALIAERYVVDYWAAYVAGVTERAVFDLLDETDAVTISRLYGVKDAWRTVAVTSPRPLP